MADTTDERRPRAFVGTSGWNYDDWSPDVYPPGLPRAKRRDVYASQFDTVELNASFYRWPKETSFKLWHDALPDGFRMTVKAPKALTHTGRLRNLDDWRETLIRDWTTLGDRAGMLLVQLAPSQQADLDLLDRFLHDMPDQIPVAMEFRHASWHTDETQAVLRDHDAAYVVMSGPQLPCNLWATASRVYVRFHGPDAKKLYIGEYGDQAMDWWADRCAEWLADGREVWAYFNNDYDANGVRDARRLRSGLAARGWDAGKNLDQGPGIEPGDTTSQ